MMAEVVGWIGPIIASGCLSVFKQAALPFLFSFLSSFLSFVGNFSVESILET